MAPETFRARVHRCHALCTAVVSARARSCECIDWRLWGWIDDDEAQAWRLFQIRRALLANNHLCISMFGAPFSAVQFPELLKATSSLLYINAVSLLDDALEIRLGPTDSEKISKLGARLMALQKRGDLLDYDTLDAIRDRRNDLGHEIEKEATIEELDFRLSSD